MTDKSHDAKSTKTEPEKKQPETVLLTAEELRAIAGGATAPAPLPVAKVLTAHNPRTTPGV